MRNDGPHIEVDHSDNTEGAQAVGSTYDMDNGVLAMPSHIHIGGKSFDGSKIENYKNQVEEYDVWLEEQIQQQNIAVMAELDTIYNKAINNGIILKTRCCPAPYITHAHVVKRMILSLASG